MEPMSEREDLLHEELMRALNVIHDAASALGARRLLATKRETMIAPVFESMTEKAWDDRKIENALLDTWELIVMAIEPKPLLKAGASRSVVNVVTITDESKR
jgi:hypothetical protein